MTAVKIATSLPEEQFSELESRRAELGLKRSAAIQEALALWLSTHRASSRVAEYVSGYMATPEDDSESESGAMVEAWADGLEAEDW